MPLALVPRILKRLICKDRKPDGELFSIWTNRVTKCASEEPGALTQKRETPTFSLQISSSLELDSEFCTLELLAPYKLDL